MIDIKLVREQTALVAENCRRRQAEVDLEDLLRRDAERLKLKQTVEDLRAERNKRSTGKPTAEELALLKKLSDEIKNLEELLKEKESAVNEVLEKLPNLTHPSVPVGESDTANQVLRQWGAPPEFNFTPRDHLALGESLDIIDVATAPAVVGARFSYLKGAGALLEFALIQHALSLVINQVKLQEVIAKNNLAVPPTPFIPVIPPALIKEETMAKMARLEPREERYHIPGDNLYLVGSAEHTLGPLHLDQIIPEAKLPLRYVGFSPAFRREAGTYGKYTHGIFRVHQFDKLEFESFTVPEQSEAEQDFLVALQETLMQSLQIPYRVVINCTGDMGLPDFRQLDLEAWLPSQNQYRETHTADLMTDYQARRLNTKVRRRDGKTELVHMNDATVFAIGRALIAILENYQQADGSVMVPEVLRSYLGFDRIKPPAA
ncbi:MAG: serine--tRNA ligase [Candidatus Magasanikbacteria bacterium]|nr:serine--tRNA ligase [Candidatus Magasanikbacteria bacterium]